RRLRLLFLFGLFGGSDGHTQDCLSDSAGDARLHLLEKAVRFALVGHEGVLLAVAAQINALAELLHRGEVLDPVRVDRAKKDPSLHRACALLSQLLLARLVRFFDDLRHTVTQLVLLAQLPDARGPELRTMQHRPEPGDALRGEDADQVVLERAEEPGAARVALTAGPAAKLVVDAPRFVALGADDVEPAEVGDALPEQDVDTAAGHVRRERDGAS